MISNSTNKEDFLAFLKLVVEEIKEGTEKPLLMLDNHRAHHSNIVKEYML